MRISHYHVINKSERNHGIVSILSLILLIKGFNFLQFLINYCWNLVTHHSFRDYLSRCWFDLGVWSQCWNRFDVSKLFHCFSLLWTLFQLTRGCNASQWPCFQSVYGDSFFWKSLLCFFGSSNRTIYTVQRAFCVEEHVAKSWLPVTSNHFQPLGCAFSNWSNQLKCSGCNEPICSESVVDGI